jgi:radical SAM protein with 4Fe4S-binding SPASM domain
MLSREIFRCGLGTTNASIGPNGDIYSCQEQTSQDSIDNPFYIGNIYDGIDTEKHSALLAEFRNIRPIICENENYCENCRLRKICYEIRCPSASKQRFNNFFIRAKTECFFLQTLAELAQGVLSIEHKNIENFLKTLLTIEGSEENGE